jgi:hypothetical protein
MSDPVDERVFFRMPQVVPDGVPHQLREEQARDIARRKAAGG